MFTAGSRLLSSNDGDAGAVSRERYLYEQSIGGKQALEIVREPDSASYF
jgi:hypothetical protein